MLLMEDYLILWIGLGEEHACLQLQWIGVRLVLFVPGRFCIST
jgi:hypothetical protein